MFFFLLACSDFGIVQTIDEVIDTEIIIDEGVAVAQKLDVLLVVDESGSMAVEHTMLSEQLPNFLSNLNGPDFIDLDWQVGVASADPGVRGAYGWVSKDAQDSLGQLTSLIDDLDAPGEFGLEKGLDATLISMVWDTEHRQDADLLVVWVSDEPDQSANTADSYLSQTYGFRPYPFTTQHAAIVYESIGDNCWDSEALVGNGYIQAADLVLNLCQPETWVDALTISSDHLAEINTRWFLSRTPVYPEEILVYWAGVEYYGWTYNSAANSIDLNNMPDVGIEITIIYQTQRYSVTEIDE